MKVSKNGVLCPLFFGLGFYALSAAVVYVVLSFGGFSADDLTTPFLRFAARIPLLFSGYYTVSAWCICFLMSGIVFTAVLLLSTPDEVGRRKGMAYFGYIVGGVFVAVAVITMLSPRISSPFIDGKPSSFLLFTTLFLSVVSVFVGSNCLARRRVKLACPRCGAIIYAMRGVAAECKDCAVSFERTAKTIKSPITRK